MKVYVVGYRSENNNHIYGVFDTYYNAMCCQLIFMENLGGPKIDFHCGWWIKEFEVCMAEKKAHLNLNCIKIEPADNKV